MVCQQVIKKTEKRAGKKTNRQTYGHNTQAKTGNKKAEHKNSPTVGGQREVACTHARELIRGLGTSVFGCGSQVMAKGGNAEDYCGAAQH